MIDFISENKEKLNIKIEKLLWPDKYRFSITDIEFRFSIDGQTYSGRGTSFDSNLSLTKALSEAIERYMVKNLKKENSNGVAVHPVEAYAKQSAINELKERDLFLCHHLTNTPMKLLLIGGLDNNCQAILDFLEKYYVNVKVFQMGSVNENTICVILDGRNCSTDKFGIIIGASYSEDLNSSIEKAMLEALIDFVSILENGVRSISLDEFNQLEYVAPEDHLKVARNIDYANSYFDILEQGKAGSFIRNEHDNTCEISIESIKIGKMFDNLDLKMFQAKSDKLQSLYFGKTTNEYLNMKRLKQFKGTSFSTKDINRLPHPFG